MFPLPSLPTPVLDTQVPNPFDRECHFLMLLADTFAYELKCEMRLRLEGAASLPPEWFTYLERERQDIVDKIHQIKRPQSFEPTAPSYNAQVDYPAPFVLRHIVQTLPSTSASRIDIEAHDIPTIPYSTRNISEHSSRLNSAHNICSPHQHKDSLFYRSALPEATCTLALCNINPVSRSCLTNNNYSYSLFITRKHLPGWHRELNSQRR